MHRSPRVVLAWAIAALVAIVTARIVVVDLATLHRRAQTLGRDVRVVVATRGAPLGAALTAGDVDIAARPASLVPPDALRERDDATGRVVSVPFLAGDVLRAAHLAPAERSGLDGIVPVGTRAVHVVAHDGYRPPLGAVVDVLTAFEAPAAAVAARGARVVGVDAGEDATAEAGAGVTVLVPESEAPAVAYAAISGRITLALAPPESACCNRPRAP
jgi:Flp pilus assembly protein CpaB